MNLRFYKCNTCGQIVAIVKGTRVPVNCCGEEMEYINPNEIDASEEKHVPIVTEFRNCCNKVVVNVGETPHPSIREHYIQWIALETDKGMQYRSLLPGEKPEAIFYVLPDEKVVDAFAYCNIHELWKTNTKK